jgi:hypothetical protein
MQETPEAVAAILKMASKMESMPGFPRTDDGLEGYAEGICRIIQDQPQKELLAMETAQILIKRAMDDFERFPTVREMSDFYRDELRFQPAYKGPVDMVEVEWARANQEPKWERSKQEPGK